MARRRRRETLAKLAAGALIVVILGGAGWFVLRSTDLAPLIAVDAPIADTAATPGSGDAETVRVAVRRNGEVSVDARIAASGDLISAIEAERGTRRDIKIVLETDRDLTSDEVLGLMTELRNAGYTNVGLAVREPG